MLIYSPEDGYFATLFEDITELKNTQKKLKEKEEKQQHLSKYAPVGIYQNRLQNPTNFKCKRIHMRSHRLFRSRITFQKPI